jgi:hypothetical protein
VKVSCAKCQTLFEARTRQATFCGVKCRQAASREDREARKEGKIAPISVISPPETPDSPPRSSLVATTLAKLEEAEAVDTVEGQIALRLAEKLSQPGDTGSAMASLARQLSAAMAEALAAGTKKTDVLDELSIWRQNKASGA